MKFNFAALLASAAIVAAPAMAQDLRSAVEADYEHIFNLYKDLHENPELSFRESRTMEKMAGELEAIGFEVTTGVGDKWARNQAKISAGEVLDGVGGYGLVAVMENGDGPTVMIRADMDALPLEEKTGVAYESKAVGVDYKGQTAPVMHACAHDSHMAIAIGAARQLVEMKDQWSGTLMLIGQPAEEIGWGALAMLADGLFERFPKPDYVLATHTTGRAPAGAVAYTPGFALANVDSVDIYVKGVGAHGSTPHLGKDPIVIGAQIVNALQTLVSRELKPGDVGVVTVGSFQGGFKHNIIPDEAHLQITVRSYEDDVRDKLIAGIERIAINTARAAGLEGDMLPKVVVEDPYTPSTYNDPEMTERVMAAVAGELGDERVVETPAVTGGEDFSQFHRADRSLPTLIFWTGGADPDAIAKAEAGEAEFPPSNHSPFFAPIPRPTLITGVRAVTAGTLELFAEASGEDAVDAGR